MKDILGSAAKAMLPSAVSLLCKSIKVEFENYGSVEKLDKSNQNYVLAFWHGTMIIPWYLGKDKNIAALVSRSKDGEILSRLLEKWNYKVVRGSSSKGGDEALQQMIDLLKNNYSLAVTPDGPRGPKHKMKAGAVVAAKKASKPIVLAGAAYKRKKVLNNWDNFQIPYFFTKCKIVFSDPVYVDKEMSYDETSSVIVKCQEKLIALQAEAENLLNKN